MGPCYACYHAFLGLIHGLSVCHDGTMFKMNQQLAYDQLKVQLGIEVE